MVDEFSSFARMPKARPARDDLTDCVRQALFLMRVGRPDIAFEERLPDEPVFAEFDRRLISQALTNVLKNATEGIDALGEHHRQGVIVVTLVRRWLGLRRDRRQRQRQGLSDARTATG